MSRLATVIKATGELKAGDVVEMRKRLDGEQWEVGKKGGKPVNVVAKALVPFPVVKPALDPARDLHTIEIMPMRWFLRQVWFNDPTKKTPKGMAGTHFADPSLAECSQREVIVPWFEKEKGDDLYKHTQELSRSIKLVLDADHGYSATFQPTGNKDIPHTGADMGPQLMGLYAEKTTGERDPMTGKLTVTGDVFIPLSAIVQDPKTYCDRDKFPCFYDHSPNIVNLKDGLAKPIARSADKEKDYGDGFKEYIAALRALTFKMAGALILVHTVIAVKWGFGYATLTTITLAYALIKSKVWQNTKKKLKKMWTEEYPVYREYWRFKKDDEIARQFNYNFPFVANNPLLRTFVGKFLPTDDANKDKKMSSDYLPPHITHEDKGVAGDKKGDHRIQYAVFGLSLFYLAHYTPIVGIALEWCIALLFVVLPLVGQRGTELLADVTEATATYYQRYELSYYADQLLHMATAVPTYGRRTARVWTRKVLYSSIWRKNKASLELPEVGDATYDAVMPELFSICEEEYGFKHNDERVCKAMFKRTEDKHVDNVEHFTFLALLVLLPALMLTPKDKRSSTFFIALPIVFFACFVLIPHELRASLMYFGDLGLGNASSSY